MPMSKSASSSPTPRSTSRVMMMGLIGSDERTVGLVHRTTTGARLVLWNPADGILPKDVAYPTHGRVMTVTTFIACCPRFSILPAPHAVPRGGATFQTGGEPRPEDRPTRCPTAGRSDARRSSQGRRLDPLCGN